MTPLAEQRDTRGALLLVSSPIARSEVGTEELHRESWVCNCGDFKDIIESCGVGHRAAEYARSTLRGSLDRMEERDEIMVRLNATELLM